MQSNEVIARLDPRRVNNRAPARFSARRLAIPDLLVVETVRHRDDRGSFVETWRLSDFTNLGLPEFVQDNHVHSLWRGTLRGLHFQRSPHAQAKLIRPLRGAIFDVAVDLRVGSPTFGTWAGVTLSADDGDMLFVPRGFAHGYCTLEHNTAVAYRCDAYHRPESEGGLNAFDPALGIDWPMPAAEMILSDRDRALPAMGAIGSRVAIGASR
jgi:dTDP-4-dehydrorhamnose 3,5-epimerase